MNTVETLTKALEWLDNLGHSKELLDMMPNNFSRNMIRETIAREEANNLDEISRLHDAAPAMYRALKTLSANDHVMLDVLSSATRQIIIEALRLAEGKPTK